MTLKRMRYLQELLAVLGLEGRLHLEWISSAEAQKFVQVVTDFTEKIKMLGPSPLAVFLEKTRARAPKSFRVFEEKIIAPDSGLFFHKAQHARGA